MKAGQSPKLINLRGSLLRLSKRLAACGFLRGISGNADGFESALVGF